jgi:hypothetical protein
LSIGAELANMLPGGRPEPPAGVKAYERLRSILTIGVAAMNETLPTESDKPADEQVEMPLPSELSIVFLGGLFVLALLDTWRGECSPRCS